MGHPCNGRSGNYEQSAGCETLFQKLNLLRDEGHRYRLKVRDAERRETQKLPRIRKQHSLLRP